MSPPRVAVVGAAGYVGQELMRALQYRGFHVLAAVRERGRIQRFPSGVATCSLAELGAVEPCEVVINLAYPSGGDELDYRGQNAALASALKSSVRRGAALVHVSTQAVFGISVDRRVVLGRATRHRDVSYVELKTELENELLDAVPDRLAIVRLGNVWGPNGSPWTSGMAARVLFGAPAYVAGTPGYSNITDVANAADYIAFLALTATRGSRLAQFHHLAEFSSVRWKSWSEGLAQRFGVDLVAAAPAGLRPSGAWDELSSAIRRHSPLVLLRELRRARVFGSLARSVLPQLPSPFVKFVKRRMAKRRFSLPIDPTEAEFLSILEGNQEFKTHIHGDWAPPVTLEASWARVTAWLIHAGYPLGPT